MAIDKLTSQSLASGSVTSDAIATGAITVSDIPDGEITAAKLGATAISDKLGYTPVNPASISNVQNKSSATIRSEITSSNVTTALGYTPLSKSGDTASSPIKSSGYNNITNTNLNTLTVGGVYMGYSLNGANNGPVGSGWAMVDVATNGSDQVFQRYQEAGYDGGRIYVRFSTDGGTTWSAWKAIGTPGQLDYSWFYNTAKVDRWRGGIDVSSSGNSWTATAIQNLYNDANEGYYSVGFVGHSEGLEVKNFGGSIGTVQWAHNYGNKPMYRNRTDNSSWGSWYQL